jgi:hypothetical protein
MDTTTVKWIADIDHMSFEQLRIEFMRFSPTYQLVHEWQGAPTNVFQVYLKAMKAAMALNVRRGLFAAGATTFKVRESTYLESLFEAAKFAYLSYEDINMPYEQWWARRGHLVFDSALNKAVVRDLGTIDASNIETSTKGVRAAVKQLATDKSSRLHMLISVPMYMSYRDATAQLDTLLKANLLSRSKQPRLRKQLHGKRHHETALLKKLKLLMYRCMYPDSTLADIGLKANISPTNALVLHGKQYTDEDKAMARRVIALSASRALLAAEYIAERAARDTFPDPRRTYSLGIDWKSSRKYLLKAWPNLKG